MDGWARDSSDEEPSMPQFQLNAITEALLADLDPTGTAMQDERAVHRRRDAGRETPKRPRRPLLSGTRHGGSGWKDTPLESAIGGDSVALGSGFEEMAKPPRRPKKQVNFDLPAEKDERREVTDERAEDRRLGSHDNESSPPEQRPAREPSQLRSSPSERPMRRVLISPPRRGGGSPKISPSSSKPAPLERTTREQRPNVAASASSSEKPPTTVPVRHRKVVVNGTSYRILKKLGRGGSGRVYEVMAPDTQSWAFKAIPLAALDDRAKRQIQNEVALLQSLRMTERVVYLKDWCVDEAKNAIHIIMELGQIDLENIIKDHMEREEELDTVFVGYYWREMLRCIAALHRLDIVHADIKPANFVSIHGMLKIVDFGIAHSLPDDTINIYLDHQAGTPNYMAPETLQVLGHATGTRDEISTRSRVVRFGKPSDMWSLGCVLHLMVYGRQPFAHVRGLAPKMLAITDAKRDIELEHHGLGAVRVPEGLRRTMKKCLERNPGKRPTAQGLLAGSADAMVREKDVERVIGDVMHRMARREVRREDLDVWVAEAMDEVAGL